MIFRYESEKEREKREKQEAKKIGRNIGKKIIRDAKKVFFNEKTKEEITDERK